MNFTREPIILSVITPKEGSKLVLRNSHLEGQEDYFVDAVEVVSFEGAIFFRSLERPKSFVLPVSSYEVLEVKEARMVLKSAEQEKSIKIGGGADERSDKLKEKKRGKRRKPSSMHPPPEAPRKEGGMEAEENPPASSSVLKKIFPPPNTLIKEKLARYKNEEFFEENILPLMDDSSKEKGEENPPLPEKDIISSAEEGKGSQADVKQEEQPFKEEIEKDKESEEK